jgi:hypothetical protein
MLEIKCCHICKYFKKCKIVKQIQRKESNLKKKTDFGKLFCIEFEKIKRMGRDYNGKDRTNE